MATDDPNPSPSSGHHRASQARSLLALGLEAEEMGGESRNYRPLRELARGGMGVVFDAHDAKLQRSVAMKVMLRGRASAEETQRFFQEARVLGQLAHPNIVPIYDVGTDEEGRPFYAMKLVGGSTLHDILHRLKAGERDTLAKCPLSKLLTVLQKVCDAIAFAHARGIIHRDLKPQNIMVGEFGEVLVMDWGLAKILSGSAATQAAANTFPVHGQLGQTGPTGTLPINDAIDATEQATGVAGSAASLNEPKPASGMGPASAPKISFGPPERESVLPSGGYATMEGAVMGTPSYMSPEQAAGSSEDIGPQSDVFALGGLLYAVLTLHPPVQGKTQTEILSKVREGKIVPPSLHSSRPAAAAPPETAGQSARNPSSTTSLPHLPGGRVPDALSAVAMRALTVDRAQRYQTVVAFEADLAAYQGGFATSAEHASLGRQFWLLMRRHRIAAAALAVVLVLSLGFVARLIVSERRAERSAAEAIKAKDAAQASAAETRRALAKAQVSLAEAAYHELDSRAMIATLEVVPSDLREGDWTYLRHHADNSQAKLVLSKGRLYIGAVGHPHQPGIFALASTERAIHLVDVRTGQRTGQVPLSPRQAKFPFFRSLDFSPDGKQLLVGCMQRGGLSIYNLATGQAAIEWDAPETDFARFNRSGTLVLDISLKRELTVRDPVTGRKLWSRKSFIRALFTAGGQIIASDGDKLQRLDATTGTLIQTLPPLRGRLFNMALSPDDTTLFYANSTDVFVRGMRLADGGFTFERALTDSPAKWPLVVLSADGRQVVGAVTDDGHKTVVRVWDAATGTQLRTLRGHHCNVEQLALHPLTGEVVATGIETHSWAIASRSPAWELDGTSRAGVFLGADDLFTATGVPLQLKEHGQWNDRIAPLPAGFIGGFHAASSGDHGVIGINGSRTGDDRGATFLLARPGAAGLTLKPTKLQGRTAITLRLRPSPDGQLLAACDEYSGLSLHEAATGNVLSKANPAAGFRSLTTYEWLTPTRLIGLACTGPRGEASNQECVVLWEAPSGRILQRLTNAAAMDGLASLPGGTQFAEAGADKRIRIRDATTLKVLREFRAHDGPITALAAHPTQPLLATASADLTIRIWKLADGKMLEELPPSVAVPRTLQFSPSGNRLASVDQRGKVRIWDFGSHALGAPQVATK